MKYQVIGDYLQVDNDYIILYDKFYESIVPDRLFIKLSEINSVAFHKVNDKFICYIHQQNLTYDPKIYSFFIKEYNEYIDTMIAFTDIVKNVLANGRRLGDGIPPNYGQRVIATDIGM